MGAKTQELPNPSSSQYSNTDPELIFGSIAAAAIAATAWATHGSLYPLAWVAVVQLVYGARFWSARKAHQTMAEGSPAPDQRILQIGLVVTGLLWGSAAAGALMLFGLGLISGMLIAAVAALSILVLGCYLGERRLVLPFVISAATPLGASALFLLDKSTVVVGVASLLYMAVVSVSAKYIDQLAQRFHETRTERDEFQSKVRLSEQEIKRLELGARTNNEKREALEHELNEVSSNLVISEGKADALSNALERVTPYDTETGLLNAKKFANVIEREWARMLRQEQPITAVHVMLDNFDNYNESYGNIAHEAAIRRVAELMRKTGTRPGDVVGRIDENKFVLLFPEADHKNGVKLADVVRKQIRRLNMPNLNSPMHSAVTASFGVATVIPNSDLSIDEFQQRADAALYEAQFQGGDKVVRYRTMNSIRLERWDRDQEGDLTPDGLVRKLAVLGYETQAITYRPGDYESDKRRHLDTIDAIVQGQLKVSLEGESRILHPGDCLFIPKGLVTSAEVVGTKSVICLEGIRS